MMTRDECDERVIRWWFGGLMAVIYMVGDVSGSPGVHEGRVNHRCDPHGP